jgi:hypothetical protein
MEEARGPGRHLTRRQNLPWALDSTWLRACGITVIQNRSSFRADVGYGSRTGLTQCGERSAYSVLVHSAARYGSWA